MVFTKEVKKKYYSDVWVTVLYDAVKE